MAILKGIFSMSIIGSIMSFILLLIAPLTKKNFSSSWHYKVSIIILIFFILPIGSLIQYPIPTRIIPNIPPIETEKSDDLKTIVKTGDIQDRLEVQDIEGGYKEDYKDEIKQENYATREARINNNIVINLDIASYEDIILYAWIIGMIALFLLKIIPYIKFKSAILKNSLEVQDTEILSLFNQCKDEFNIDRKIDLRTWHYVGSPMLIGIFNPIILIPNADEDRKVLKMIFLHELNHYKRRDIILKALGFIVNIVHWFNPIIYILLKKIDIYCEYSIDEKVVNKMEIEDRKYYGEAILKLIDNSFKRRNALTTAMSSYGKELKYRLENILFYKKNSRFRYIISLFVLFLIIISGLFTACSIMPTNATEGKDPFIVYIKNDGLYFADLNTGKETKIHEGSELSYPIISKYGDYIAYTYDGYLYVFDFENGNSDKLAEKIVSYDWMDEDIIIYSTEETGFTIHDMKPKGKDKVQNIGRFIDDYYYDNFRVSKKGNIYGNRISCWTTDEGKFAYNTGIVEINLKGEEDFTINTIIEGKKSTDEGIGYNPIIWDITEDGKYIYIMEKPTSASLSADGVGIGMYDVEKKTHTEFENIVVLPYRNNLTINPKDNNLIGIIEGSSREMVLNKKAVLLDINKDKTYNTINFMNKDLVAMTPNFTLDGDKLLYSATKGVDVSRNFIDYNKAFEDWENEPHNIYEYDLKTSEIRKITEGDHFDFMPVSISEDGILFSRYKGNGYYSLIILANGKEKILADNIIFDSDNEGRAFGFYGHIETEKAIDIFLNEKKMDLKSMEKDEGEDKKSQELMWKKDEEINRLKDSISEKEDLIKSLEMVRFSSYSRLDEYNDSFDNLKNVYNINSNYTIKDDWYVINEDYFQIELLGYDNAQKVDFYVLRLESEEEPILILTDTDYTDGWKYTNENISDIIDKHDKSLPGGFSYEPYFVIYTEVALEDDNTIKTPRLPIYNVSN